MGSCLSGRGVVGNRDEQSFPVQQCIDDLSACLCQGAGQAGARDPHSVGRCLLVQALIVHEPEGLEFIGLELQGLLMPPPRPTWLKAGVGGCKIDTPSTPSATTHRLAVCYEHMTKNISILRTFFKSTSRLMATKSISNSSCYLSGI
jgi:hypothetical protein